jgi:hypothetical protein
MKLVASLQGRCARQWNGARLIGLGDQRLDIAARNVWHGDRRSDGRAEVEGGGAAVGADGTGNGL